LPTCDIVGAKKTQGSLHLFTRGKVGLVNPDPKPQLSPGYVGRCRFGSDLQVQNHTFRWRHKGVWLCSKCVLVKPRKPLPIVKRNVPKNASEGMLPKFKNCRLATLLERKEIRVSLHLFARARDRFFNPDPKPQLPLGRVVRCRFGSDFQVQNHAFRWCQLGGLAVFKMRFGEILKCIPAPQFGDASRHGGETNSKIGKP